MIKKFYNSIYYILTLSILCTSFCYYYISEYKSDRWEYIRACIDYKEYMKFDEYKDIKNNYFEKSKACDKIVDERLYHRTKHYNNLSRLGLVSFALLCISGAVVLIKTMLSIKKKIKYVVTDNNSLKSQRYGLIIAFIGILLLLFFILNLSVDFIDDDFFHIATSTLGVLLVLSGFLLLYCIPQKIMAWAQKGK